MCRRQSKRPGETAHLPGETAHQEAGKVGDVQDCESGIADCHGSQGGRAAHRSEKRQQPDRELFNGGGSQDRSANCRGVCAECDECTDDNNQHAPMLNKKHQRPGGTITFDHDTHKEMWEKKGAETGRGSDRS